MAEEIRRRDASETSRFGSALNLETRGRGNNRNSNQGRSKSRNSNRNKSKTRLAQQVVSEPIVVWGKGDKVIEIPFAVGVGTRCMYLKPFRKWSRAGSFRS